MSKLKLKAEGVQDVTVFGSYLQDAALKVEDFAWLPSTKRFALVCNRYMWEEAGRGHYRVRTGLHFNQVRQINIRGIPQNAKTQVLELLTLHATEQGGRALIDLAFAGGGDIRLEAECIDGTLEDIGEPWETASQPHHED